MAGLDWLFSFDLPSDPVSNAPSRRSVRHPWRGRYYGDGATAPTAGGAWMTTSAAALWAVQMVLGVAVALPIIQVIAEWPMITLLPTLFVLMAILINAVFWSLLESDGPKYLFCIVGCGVQATISEALSLAMRPATRCRRRTTLLEE